MFLYTKSQTLRKKQDNLMFAYLIDARCYLKCKSIERLRELGGLESLLNSCEQLDAKLHPGLDPEVGSRIDD